MRVRPQHAAALLGLGLLCAASPVQASSIDLYGLFCGPFLPGGGAITPPQTCVETAVGGSGPSDPLGFNGSPLQSDKVNVPGGTSATAGGSGDLSGSATATADYGLLRANVGATNAYPAGTAGTPRIASRATASFSDRGLISSVSLVTGAIAHAKATLDVDGIFSGDGDAEIKLVIGGTQSGALVNFTTVLLDGVEDLFRELEFDTLVGEEITVAMYIRARAGAGASQFSTLDASGADLGNTAHLYLDLDDASFGALSGHDYRLDAVAVPAPEPATATLLGLAVMGVAAVRRRRAA